MRATYSSHTSPRTMADFLAFDEGRTQLLSSGLPSTCYFLLSTKDADSHTVGETLAAADLGEITGTGYTRQSQSEPAPTAGTAVFAEMTFATTSHTDWPSNVKSIVLATDAATSGEAICAWNLQTGGAARDMSTTLTTEKVTPTLVLG